MRKKNKQKSSRPRKKTGVSNAQALPLQLSHLIEAGVLLHRQGNLSAAAEKYQKALAINSENPDANHLLGVVATQHGDFSTAVQLIEKSLSSQPFNALAHYNLGFALQKVYRCDKAAICYQAAININPSYIEAHVNLSSMYMYLGKYLDAEKVLRKSIALAPDRADILNNLGMCLYELGDQKSALIYCQKALKVDANNAEAYNNIARIWQKTGNINDAISCYRSAVKSNPRYLTALNNLAAVLAINGQDNAALSTYFEALAINPHCATSHIALAIHYWRSDDWHKTKFHINAVKGYRQIDYTEKQNQYVKGYYSFITALLGFEKQETQLLAQTNDTIKSLYVVGDSHCLSYANCLIDLDGVSHRCVSKLIVGCKAWHLANEDCNEYKVHFNAILQEIPQGSKVALVFGEIDCRIDEGIIPLMRKKSLDMKHTISQLVEGYFSYVNALCGKKKMLPMFINVPAPVHDQQCAEFDMEALVEVIGTFNSFLFDLISATADLDVVCDLVDVYHLTNDKSGCSRGRYHIDGVHLQPSALSQVFVDRMYSAGGKNSRCA